MKRQHTVGGPAATHLRWTTSIAVSRAQARSEHAARSASVTAFILALMEVRSAFFWGSTAAAIVAKEYANRRPGRRQIYRKVIVAPGNTDLLLAIAPNVAPSLAVGCWLRWLTAVSRCCCLFFSSQACAGAVNRGQPSAAGRATLPWGLPGRQQRVECLDLRRRAVRRPRCSAAARVRLELARRGRRAAAAAAAAAAARTPA
jgi:hypothetical protein